MPLPPVPSGARAPRLVVLDLDGTLIRLAVDWGALRARLVALAREHGLRFEGVGVLGLLAAARSSGPPACAEEMERVARAAEVAGAERGPGNEALRAWLDSLPADTALAVLSLNSRDAAERALERLGLRGRVGPVVGREDVTRHKPDPEGLIRIMSGHGAEPHETLMIGDSPGDHGCARAAGVPSLDVAELGVRWVAV